MLPHRGKRIKELSRGLSQFVQFLVTIIHQPELLVLDEPFANLDPVNTEIIKDMLRQQRRQGRAIILSTHHMDDIEELCDRVLMIDKGKDVLHGRLSDVKAAYRDNSVLVEYQGEPGELRGVVGRHDGNGWTRFFLDGTTSPQDVLAQLVAMGVAISRFEVATPSLHDIFLQVVGRE